MQENGGCQHKGEISGEKDGETAKNSFFGSGGLFSFTNGRVRAIITAERVLSKMEYRVTVASVPVEKGADCAEWGASPRESVTVKPERDKSDTCRNRKPPAETGMRSRVVCRVVLPTEGDAVFVF